MELDSVDRPVLAAHGLVRACRRGCGDLEPFWDSLDLVIMGCPYLESVRKSLEEVVVGCDVELHPSELGSRPGTQLSSEVLADELHPGAYPEDREIGLVQILSVVAHTGRIACDARCAAGEHEAVDIRDLVERCGVGNDLGIDLEISENAPLAVGPLPSVVDDVDFHAYSDCRAVLIHWDSGNLIP